MKYIYFIVLIILFRSNILISQPDILFVLPGESSVIASRIYNLFTEFYRGNSNWITSQNLTNSILSNYNNVIEISESFTENNNSFVTMKIFSGNFNRIITDNSISFNSDISNFALNKLKVLKLAFELIKEFDPVYYEELKEVFEDLLEED